MVYLKITVLLFLVLPLSTAQGQNTFEKEIDFPTASNGKAIVQTPDGGYFVGGLNESVPSLVKFDAKGNVLWAKILGNGTGREIDALTQSSDSNFFAAGTNDRGAFIIKFDSIGNTIWSKSILNVFSTPCLSLSNDGGCIVASGDSPYNYLPYVMRIGQDGSLLWKLTIPKTKHADFFSISSIIQYDDSSYLVLGYGADTTLATTYLPIILKIGLSGKILWYHAISTFVNSYGYSICKTTGDGFALTGTIHRSDIPYNDNIYVAKCDYSGALLWGKEIDAFARELGTSIVEAGNGDIMVSCVCTDNIASESDSSMILRLDNKGNIKFLKLLNGHMFVNAMLHTTGNAFVYAGTTNNPYLYNGGLLFGKLDSNGNGCNLQDHLFSDRENGEMLNDTLSVIYGGVLDTTTLKLGAALEFHELDICDISSVPVVTSEIQTISLSPNPLISGKSITVHINESLEPGLYDLSIFDMLGNLIKKENITLAINQHNFLVDVSGRNAGAYMIELRSENTEHNYGRLKLIKE